MAAGEPSFTLGIEEEYLLVDRDTGSLADAPPDLMAACTAALAEQVSPEFLRCQVEVGTRKCTGISQARDELRRLRGTIARIAESHGLRPIAASCHPTADWKEQQHTPKERYDVLYGELAGVAERMLICGMHVHVGLDNDELRIDLMNQVAYFLPHILALSASSPYWQGRDTGLDSYRMTIFDDLPRTGLPPRYASWQEYRRSIDTLIDCGLIDDTTKIWWDARPAEKFPTLELRICDTSPRLDHAVSIAAIVQSLLRKLWRLRTANQCWRVYDTFLLRENRWRAQRYGISESMIDFGRGELVAFPTLLDELIALLEEDAAALGCLDELHAARNILDVGNGATRQRQTFDAARAQGHDTRAAFGRVVSRLADEFTEDL